ncbi:MAG: TIM barrel protein [Verrucomicrobiales bacterium]|nr:TIM barrel protein [Verrucomicrobiales bacterium]
MTVSRRGFLNAGLMAGTVGVGGGSLLAAGKSTCGLAIGTYGLQSMPLPDAIRLVGKTGFDAIEITVFSGMTGDPASALISDESRKAVRAALDETGLRLCALMADLRPEADDTKHYAQLPKLNQYIQLARELCPENPPLIQTVLGGKVWENSKELFRDRIANWNQVLADQKGYLSIKPHRGSAMSTPENAVWLLKQLGNPRRIKMVYDYSHYALRESELTIADTVETALPITNYVAVKDAEAVGDKVRFALPGETDTWDQSEVLKRFYGGGYRGDFCCEVSSQIWRNNPDYDPVKATQTCYENMAKAFEKAGIERA